MRLISRVHLIYKSILFVKVIIEPFNIIITSIFSDGSILPLTINFQNQPKFSS